MSRLPLAAFGALALATVGAFFISQHLKVTTPLISGITYDASPHNIVPADGRCPATTIHFFLLHRADSVDVSVVNHGDKVVRMLASGVPAGRKQQLQFTWNGRLPNGQPAPRGEYNFRVKLIHQKRTIDPLIPDFPIVIQTSCPPP